MLATLYKILDVIEALMNLLNYSRGVDRQQRRRKKK